MSKPEQRPFLAVQTCFVVAPEAIDAAVAQCEERYGWGPFLRFSAPTDGGGTTHVALGQAGATQVEIVAMEGVDNTMSAYFDAYGTGFQHLGVVCRDLDLALDRVEELGGGLCERGGSTGIRYAFVETPTGRGMMELLEPDDKVPTPEATNARAERPCLALRSATVVARDIERALAYFTPILSGKVVAPEEDELELDGKRCGRFLRAQLQSGSLRIEFLQLLQGENLYSQHLAGRDHGLVHVGAQARDDLELAPHLAGIWAARGEAFHFCASPFGAPGIRIESW